MGRFLEWLLAVMLFVPMAVFLASFFFPDVSCSYVDVDIHSGRLRRTSYLLFCQVRERIEETTVSKELRSGNTELDSAEWRRVLASSPGLSPSPHYSYHSTANQMESLEKLWHAAHFTPEARIESARRLLAAWQLGRNYHLADRYLQALGDIVYDQPEIGPKKLVNVADLPPANIKERNAD